ncbi:MAG: tetratricopeptide repeat protein [Oleispira sp.]|nr:tetratricopeptide repeat protein [Oleispira sp.]
MIIIKKLMPDLPVLSQLVITGIVLGCLSYTPLVLSKQEALNDESAESVTSEVHTSAVAAPVKKRRVRRAQTMSTKIYKKLDKVREYVDEKNYEDAESLIASLEKTKRNSYEKAMTWNMEAYLYYNREDYSNAAKSYEKIVAQDNIPASLAQTTLYSLAKLHLIQQDYEQSLVAMNRWFKVVNKPSAESHILRAQMYYQLEQYSKALPDVKSAIAMTAAAGKKPRENWLLIERAVYFQHKDYVSMERCLKDLIALYPKSSSIGQYWVQLAAVYNELDQLDAELATLETAYDLELLVKENQLISLAQAMLAKEIPYKAAQVLTQGMGNKIIKESSKNLSLLADALMLAKENDRAIKILEKTAGLSNSAKDHYRLAQIYTERQEWNSALKNVSRALTIQAKATKLPENLSESSKKSFTHVDESNLRVLKGLVLFNLNDLLLAKAEFELAAKFERSEKMAAQWLRYIDSERKRMEYIATVE